MVLGRSHVRRNRFNGLQGLEERGGNHLTRATWKRIKKLRVFISLTFLVFFTCLFIDAWHIIPADVIRMLVSIQLVPVILKGIFVGGMLILAIVVILVGITLLFGRVYCSTICPLGVMQDLLMRLRRKFSPRWRFSYLTPPHWLQYAVLGIAVLLLLLGSTMVIGDLLEPFSNYGRLASGLALPAVILSNNFIADLSAKAGMYLLYHVPLHLNSPWAISLSLLFLLTLGYLSMTEGRLYCNTFCPTGAILSLLARISAYKFVIKDSSCNDCGACDKVCKAQCINSKDRRIDFAACVMCFNCLRSCPEDAIAFERRHFSLSGVTSIRESAEEKEHVRGRREFIKELTIPTATLLIVPGLAQTGAAMTGHKSPITPPGSINIRHFTTICTSCHLCVNSCPTGVLQPSFLEYGLSGVFQPKMDYTVNYCNYDCVICGEVCPTGAIKLLDVNSKKLVQIGKAQLTKDDCVVVSKKKDCAACSEHCPTKAVHTVPYENGLRLPEVDDSICIGCGACEYSCPVIPRKAIIVAANTIHLAAKKPAIEHTKEKAPVLTKDFPF